MDAATKAVPKRSRWRAVVLVCGCLAFFAFAGVLLIGSLASFASKSKKTTHFTSITDTNRQKSPSVSPLPLAPKPTPIPPRPISVAPKPAPIVPRPIFVAPKPAPIAPRPIPVAPKPAPIVSRPIYVAPAPRVGGNPANQARRQYLRQEIARLQAAIRTDRELVNRQAIAAPAFRIGGAVLSSLFKNSTNPKDKRVAPVAAPIAEQGGQELGNKIDQARAQTQTRLYANEQKLREYQAELYRLGG